MKLCKKCNTEFPNWVKIDDKWKNLGGNRSYCLKCSPWRGQTKRRGTSNRLTQYKLVDDIEHKLCGSCNQWIPVSEYTTRSDRPQPKSYCKACTAEEIREARRKIKHEAVLYKGGVCVDCNQSFPDRVFDFHHLNPSEKDFSLSRYPRRKLESIKNELDKCVLLCANCHRIRHGD